MKILSCIKQVPEKEARLRIAADGRWIQEDGLTFVISECDRYGVEAALRLKERAGGEVVVLSVGDERSGKGIKEALAMGADRAIHVQTGACAKADAVTIARVIAAAVKGEGFDVVLTGQQSDDLGYNAVGPALAEHLGMHHVQIVLSLEPASANSLRVVHELDNNLLETLEVPLPAVLGVQSGIHEVRYASLKGIMGAGAKPQRKVTPAELGLSDAQLAPKVRMEQLAVPLRSSKAQILEGDAATVARALVEKLKTEAKVL
jgi:electron transfer flavoprotein beta subunit